MRICDMCVYVCVCVCVCVCACACVRACGLNSTKYQQECKILHFCFNPGIVGIGSCSHTQSPHSRRAHVLHQHSEYRQTSAPAPALGMAQVYSHSHCVGPKKNFSTVLTLIGISREMPNLSRVCTLGRACSQGTCWSSSTCGHSRQACMSACAGEG